MLSYTISPYSPQTNHDPSGLLCSAWYNRHYMLKSLMIESQHLQHAVRYTNPRYTRCCSVLYMSRLPTPLAFPPHTVSDTDCGRSFRWRNYKNILLDTRHSSPRLNKLYMPSLTHHRHSIHRKHTPPLYPGRCWHCMKTQ